eukprot:symbB.v1.2.040296.t1/scaffold7130.1/size13156/2
MIANAGVASVASTIFVRIALGTLLERFGPVNVQSGLLTFGAFWVAMAAAITAPWNYTLIRFFIGCAGALCDQSILMFAALPMPLQQAGATWAVV